MASARKSIFLCKVSNECSFGQISCITRIDQRWLDKEFPHEDALTGTLGGPFCCCRGIFRGLLWRSCPDHHSHAIRLGARPKRSGGPTSKNHAEERCQGHVP